MTSAQGQRGVKILYDAFFKEIMDPDAVPELLEEFISLILGTQVKILYMLPNDSPRFAGERSLLVMDIVVQLTDGSIANVEVQKIGYFFPGQRSACYSADLLLRQYRRVRGEKRKNFSYEDVKCVYTIVLFEKSPQEFSCFSDDYIHLFSQKSNTGLELELLQKYVFIPLDIFRKNIHNKAVTNKLDAWLMFFSTDDPKDIIELINAYPEFRILYDKVYSICRNMERIMGIFSEELLELDRNTVDYMMDAMQEELERKREELKHQKQELEQKKEELKHKGQQIERANEELAQKNEELTQKKEELTQRNNELDQKEDELARINMELTQKQDEISRQEILLKQEKHSRFIILIQQIRNFALGGFPERKCAELLMADIDIVVRIYDIASIHPEYNEEDIYALLKEKI